MTHVVREGTEAQVISSVPESCYRLCKLLCGTAAFFRQNDIQYQRLQKNVLLLCLNTSSSEALPNQQGNIYHATRNEALPLFKTHV